ncbi:MAG: hypothetical protein HQL41_08325 [Alphaproteobacteria bacterium]|nr:hypothetical protein [Alphaproteobacteria bacterium]
MPSPPPPSPAERRRGLFEAFIDGLLAGPSDLAAARAGAQRVAAALTAHWRPDALPGSRDDHLVVGSVGKHTAILPMSPVNLLYVPPEGADDAPIPELLTGMAAILSAALPHAFVDVEATSVMVGSGGVAVIAQPARAHGGAFLIPGADGWMLTNPAAELAALRMADATSHGLVTRLLALLKAWRRATAAPIRPFALEVLTRTFVIEGGHEGDPSLALCEFFAWSRRHTPAELSVPGGLARLAVDNRWHPQAEAAYWRCVLANRHAATGDLPAALDEWRKVVGGGFPA